MHTVGSSSPIEAGYLRRSVQVTHVGDSLELRFSLWSLSIPSDYIQLDRSLAAFFRREAPASAVSDSRIPSNNLLALLQAQGCIASDPANVGSMRDVGNLFHAIAAEWYRDYYSHGLWPKLREATVSRKQLDAWMLRTYFLSRSAGVTAARCAALCSIPRIRRLFAKNSCEEFDHCERYYKLAGGSGDESPPVSSIAFDQQMLRLAEEDWLAHVFVALFQEKTAVFVRNARSLYDHLAERFALGSDLEPWKEHIGFDIAHSHADDFAEAFNSEDPIECTRFQASVENARVTIAYLIGGLDEIILADGGAEVVPARTGRARTLAEVHDRFRRETQALPKLARQSRMFAARLEALTFRALSYCTEHRDILVMGRLCEYASQLAQAGSTVGDVSAAQIAAENQLRESAYRTGEFVLALCALDHLLSSELLNDSVRSELDRWLSEQLHPPVASYDAACEQVRMSLQQGPALWDRPAARDPFGR